MAVIAGLLLARHLLLAQLVEPLAGAKAVVGLAFIKQLLDDFLVAVEALGLIEGALVVFQAQPGHAFQDGVHRLLGRALPVGVLNAQDEAAAVAAGVKIGIQRRARAADMQVAGGGRSETSFNRHQLPFKLNAKWRAMLANAPSCRTTMTAGAGRAPIAAMATPWSVRNSSSNFRHTLSPPRSVLLGSLRLAGADRVGDEAEPLQASPLRCRMP